MRTARAAIAGAVTMLLGVWIMSNDQTAWDEREVVIAVLALLAVVLLLMDIDPVRLAGRRRRPDDPDPVLPADLGDEP